MRLVEVQLLLALVCRVRGVTIGQVARLSAICPCQARRLVRRLERRGLVAVRRVLVSEPLPSAGPVGGWAVGGPAPDLGAISYRLKSKAVGPTRFTDVVFATPWAARLLGGVTPNLGRPLQLGHDLALVEAYLWLREHEPHLVERFVGEDFFSRRGRTLYGYLPDAVILGDAAEVVQVIECGAYDVPRLSRIHDSSSRAGIPWRIFA